MQSVGKEQAIEWRAMTPTQQQILAPLATQWNGLPAIQRVRLLEVAAKYPSMKPEARQRFQARIKNWALLSQAERKKARENYKKLKHLSPEQRAAIKRRWEIKQQARGPIRPSVPPPPGCARPYDSSVTACLSSHTWHLAFAALALPGQYIQSFICQHLGQRNQR